MTGEVRLTDDEIAQIESYADPWFVSHNLGDGGKWHKSLTRGAAQVIERIITARVEAALADPAAHEATS